MASLFCLPALDPPYHLLWVQLKLTAYLLPPESPSLVRSLSPLPRRARGPLRHSASLSPLSFGTCHPGRIPNPVYGPARSLSPDRAQFEAGAANGRRGCTGLWTLLIHSPARCTYAGPHWRLQCPSDTVLSPRPMGMNCCFALWVHWLSQRPDVG